ncbi:MAG TPA: hypothetical protein VK811_03560 [Candidatus Acidoferrum sp.]|nr:hypothetical protein [Candidatus Acidoferrum sp.]
MNRDEAKQILLLYRPGTADAEDPEVAAALALAKDDPELSRWLAEHNARQTALREKFRQIPVLAGLKEQIISEQAAKSRAASHRNRIVGVAAVAAVLISLLVLAHFFLPFGGNSNGGLASTLDHYKSQMTAATSSGYSMDLLSSDAGKVQAYLAGKQAPADYVLPAGMQKVAMMGCAAKTWQNSKAAMICFRTGKPLPHDQIGDLWLFVVDRTAVKDAPDSSAPQFAKVNGLMTATWTQGGKLYLLSTDGDESDIKKFL